MKPLKLSLRMVLLIGVIGIQVLTVCGVLLSSYITTQDALLNHARQLMLDASSQVIERSEQFLEPARITADFTRRLANTSVLDVNDLTAMERFFLEQLRLYPWFSGAYFGGHDGSFVFVKRESGTSEDEAGFLTKLIYFRAGVRHVEFISRSLDLQLKSSRQDATDDFDPRDRPWYRLAIARHELVWTEPYIFFTSRQPGISATVPAYDSGRNEYRGAIGVDIEIGQLSSFLRGLKIGHEGSAFILNRNGDVIAHPKPEQIKPPTRDPATVPRFTKINEIEDPIAHAAFSALDLPSDNVTIDGPVVRRFEYQGRNFLSVFTPFFSASWPWTMVIYVPEDDYLGVLNEQLRLNLYLGLVIAFFGCLVSIGIWQTIARPMRQLSADAAAVQAGNFNIEPKTSSVYREVSATGDAFRKMVVGLREHEQENIRLRHLQSRLMENMRQSAVGYFASAVSHELNNPLAAVLTNLQIVSRILKRSDDTPPPRLLAAVDGAQDQAERAGAIIRGLRELVEAGAADRREEDVNQMVREAVKLVGMDENLTNARYSFDLAENLPPAWMNRVQVQQVVLNLVRNAVEAMSDLEAPVIAVSTASPNSSVVEISIEDSGPGISSEISAALFQPMVTTKPWGMGVGLSICRTIVESHGGRMTVSQSAAGGAKFTFTLATVRQSGQSNAGQ